MKHREIKEIVDSVGRSFFTDYDKLFTSEITQGDSPRYSLKTTFSFPNDPPEITDSGLTVRICTDYAKQGEPCKEIGIPGRYIFDHFVRNKIFFRKVYLTTSKGRGFSKTSKIVVDHFDCPNVYDWFIDEPHYATVLNFHDLPREVRKDKVIKFVTAYFAGISNPIM